VRLTSSSRSGDYGRMRVCRRVLASVVAITALGISVGGCSQRSVQPVGDKAAVAACGHRGSFDDVALAAAFTSTAGTLRHWNPASSGQSSDPAAPVVVPPGPQFLQGRADSETIYVCFVDGAVGGSMPPPMPGSTIAAANRAVVLKDSAGHVYGFIYGRKEHLPLVRPRASVA
jgi:hypothetical protein